MPSSPELLKFVVALADDADKTAPTAAKWRQVAYTGKWKGYRDGRVFEFSRADLEQMVANFRASPTYKPGAITASAADIEAGKYDVIPWDWRHVSEMPPGTVPMEEQKARGWAMELEVRNGTDPKTGAPRAELFAFSRFFEPAASSVAKGEIKWASVTAQPHTTDKVTAVDRGWVLKSIALTNQPFLEGMVSLESEGTAPLMLEYFGRSTGPIECVNDLRTMFGLGTNAELTEVMQEVARLQGWHAGAEPPPGVDVQRQIGQLRAILNMPTLATPREVFAECSKIMGALSAILPVQQQQRLTAPSAFEQGAHPMPLPDALVSVLRRHNIQITKDTTEVDAVLALERHFGEQARIAEEHRVMLDASGAKTSGEAMVALAEAKAFAKAKPDIMKLVSELVAFEVQAAQADVQRVCLESGFGPDQQRFIANDRSGGFEPPAAGAPIDAVTAFLEGRARAAKLFGERYKPKAVAYLTYDFVGAQAGAALATIPQQPQQGVALSVAPYASPAPIAQPQPFGLAPYAPQQPSGLARGVSFQNGAGAAQQQAIMAHDALINSYPGSDLVAKYTAAGAQALGLSDDPKWSENQTKWEQAYARGMKMMSERRAAAGMGG